MNSTLEWNAIIGAPTLPALSTVKAYTGTYSIRMFASTNAAVGVAFSARTKVAAHCFVNHNGVSTSNSADAAIFRWSSSAGNVNGVTYYGNTGELQIIIAGVVVATVSAAVAGFTSVDIWRSCGLRIFADNANGYVTFYLDGNPVLSITDIDTGTYIDGVYFGFRVAKSATAWNSYAYFDDCYVDDVDGEDDNAPIPRRFLWGVVDANGGDADWNGSDGNQVDNYLLVDDVTPDAESTYVWTQAAGSVDSYGAADVVVPEGYRVVAVIPTVLARRSSITEQLKVGQSDGVNVDEGVAQDLGATYQSKWERYTMQPDGSAWNETDANATLVRIESAGTF